MTPKAFKAARKKLGLKQRELAKVLNLSELSVRRYEMPETASNHRPVPHNTAVLMKAFLEGFRTPTFTKLEKAA